MSNTVLQNPTVALFAGAGSVNKTFAGACTSGSRIIAMVSQEDNAATLTVTDDANAGSYTTDKSEGSATEGAGKVFVTSITNTASSAVTVTANPSGAVSHGLLKIIELSAGGGGVDATASSLGTGVVHSPTVDITTTTANCTVVLICCHVADLGAGGGGADSGYTGTFDQVGNGAYHSVEHKADVGAAGTKTLNFGNPSGSYYYTMAAVAYASGSPVLEEDGEWPITTLTW